MPDAIPPEPAPADSAPADSAPADGVPPRDAVITAADKPAMMGELTRRGPVAAYHHFFTGRSGLVALLRYECSVAWHQNRGGALGYALRSRLYRGLLATPARGLKWGLGVGLRHPGKMDLGEGTAVDDHALLCARGAPDRDAGGRPGFRIGPGSLIGRSTVVQAKRGPLRIGARAQIGTHCQIQGTHGVDIGNHFITGPQCYLGGSRHGVALNGTPILDQPTTTRGPLTVGDDVWLGAGVRVMEGLTLGRGVVAGAGAVITRNVPDFAVVAGVPARVVGYRGADGNLCPTPPAVADAS